MHGGRGCVTVTCHMPTLKWQWHPKIMKNDDGAKEGMLRADVHGSNRSAATYWALTRAWTTFSHCAALM